MLYAMVYAGSGVLTNMQFRQQWFPEVSKQAKALRASCHDVTESRWQQLTVTVSCCDHFRCEEQSTAAEQGPCTAAADYNFLLVNSMAHQTPYTAHHVLLVLLSAPPILLTFTCFAWKDPTGEP
jgi:hypothetical protein